MHRFRCELRQLKNVDASCPEPFNTIAIGENYRLAPRDDDAPNAGSQNQLCTAQWRTPARRTGLERRVDRSTLEAGVFKPDALECGLLCVHVRARLARESLADQ